MAENIEEKAKNRNRIIKIIKAYETFCDKSKFTDDEKKYVQTLLHNYTDNELMNKDPESLQSIYDELTKTDGISSKIVEQLKLIGFCEKDTLDCLNDKLINEIKSKKDNTCAVGGKKSKRRKQRKNNRKSKKQRNKKRR